MAKMAWSKRVARATVTKIDGLKRWPKTMTQTVWPTMVARNGGRKRWPRAVATKQYYVFGVCMYIFARRAGMERGFVLAEGWGNRGRGRGRGGRRRRRGRGGIGFGFGSRWGLGLLPPRLFCLVANSVYKPCTLACSAK